MTEILTDTFSVTLPAPKWGGQRITIVVNLIGDFTQVMICGDRNGNSWAVTASGPRSSMSVNPWGVAAAGVDFELDKIVMNDREILNWAQLGDEYRDEWSRLCNWTEAHVKIMQVEEMGPFDEVHD